MDGNYRAVRDIVWGRADTLVWLDYPFPLVLWRLTRRILWRGLAGVELYNGNRERLSTHFLTRDSLFLWLWKSHWRHRREYARIFARGEYRHLHVVRLRRPGQVPALLARLAQSN